MHDHRMTNRRRGPAVAAFVALVALAGACATTPATPATIDGAKLEQNIKDDSAKTELALAAVSCPRDRVPKAGDRFTCTGTLAANGTLLYDVAITSESGAYTYELAPGQVIDGTEAAKVLTVDIATASPDVADAKVTCPPSVVAPTATTTFECTLTAAGTTAKLSVTSERGKPLDWTYAP
jgi:hypothetical protein